MRELAYLVTNNLVFVSLLGALAAMQTSLWYHIFGYSPAPYLWLTVLNYWALTRNLTQAMIMYYFSSYIFLTMTGMPMDMVFLLHISLYALIYTMKDRVLWSGPNSFVLSCGLTALALPIFTFILSHVLETRPVSDFHFFDMIIRALLTSATSLPLYYLFLFLDKLTYKPMLPENEGPTLS